MDTSKILLLCLDEKQDPTLLKHLSAADWDELVTLAEKHDLAALLYQRLVKEKGSARVPPEIKQRLRSIYFVCLGKNTLLYHDLKLVLLHLQQANIPVIALKGAHLAELAYGNIALRPMQDIDLLVPRDELERSVTVLAEKMGYFLKQNPYTEEEMLNQQHVPTLMKPGQTNVEIHWTLAPSVLQLKIDIDEIWRHAQPAILEGVETRVLAPEDTLLYLCMHTAILHKFLFQLRALYDIAAMLKQYQGEFDWSRFERTTRQWGIVHAVYLVLYLADTCLGRGAPQELMSHLRPADFRPEMGDWAIEKMTSEKIRVKDTFVSLWGERSLLQKIRLLWDAFFPSREEMAFEFHVPENSLRLYFYYPANIIIHLGRYWRLGLRMLTRRDDPLADRVKRESILREWLKPA